MSLLQLPAFGKERPWVRTAVLRPELGSLVAAALLFIFFSIASSGAMLEIPTIARVLDTAWPLGIIAVAVGLLMIGGEIDLSLGVMVGTAGAMVGIMATEWGMNLWLAAFLSLLVCLAIGVWNGVLVVWTGMHSFVITLGTFFGLRGANVALSKHFTGDALDREHRRGGRLRLAARDCGDGLRHGARGFPHLIDLVGRVCGDRHLGAVADQDRQLDYRHGRRPRGGASGGGAGQRDQDRPVHADRERGLVRGPLERRPLPQRAGGSGRGGGVFLHHRGGGGRLPDGGRLRIGRGSGDWGVDLGDRVRRDPARRLELGLALGLPRRLAAGRHADQSHRR